MSTPKYGFLRDRPEPKKADMKSENSHRSQRFKNYPRPVIQDPELLTPEIQADITRKFSGMVQILRTYHTKLSLPEAEARVRAVLHTTYATLRTHEGQEEAPVEEMFRFNEAEDVKVVARIVEEDKEREREREEEMRRAAEREKEWVVVGQKYKKKKDVLPVLGVSRNGFTAQHGGRGGPMFGMVRGETHGGPVLGVFQNGGPRAGLRGRGSAVVLGGRGRGYEVRGRGRMQ